MSNHLRAELEKRVKASEYSMKGLSKAVGHGETLVRDIITGRTKNPSPKVVEELAGKLGCSTDELYGTEAASPRANDNTANVAPAAPAAAAQAATPTITSQPLQPTAPAAQAHDSYYDSTESYAPISAPNTFSKLAPFISCILVFVGAYMVFYGYAPSIGTRFVQDVQQPAVGASIDPIYGAGGFAILFAAFAIWKGRAK